MGVGQQSQTPDLSGGLTPIQASAATPAAAPAAAPAPAGAPDLSGGLVPKADAAPDLSGGLIPKADPPGIWDHVNKIAQEALRASPIGDIHDSAKAVQDWAAKKMSPANPHMLGTDPTFGPTENFAVGALRDTAGLVAGATTPKGLVTAAGVALAPEVAGPIMAGHGIYNAIHSWGNMLNPDVMQNELNSAAEVVGGAAASRGGASERASAGFPDELAKAKAAKMDAIQKAVPPTPTTPYEPADLEHAMPYLEAEHATTAIDSPVAMQEAATKAVNKIEMRVTKAIQADPTRVIKGNPLADAQAVLKGNVRRDFYAAGMKELEQYDLGFEREGGVKDPPMTLEKADTIRKQLNADNRRVLNANKGDIDLARSTDPGFAAREAVANSLRNGIYDELDGMGFKMTGIKDSRALRADEGSLLQVRKAAQKQEFNGEKPVAGTEKGGAIRKKAGAVAKAGLRTGGATLGAKVAGPIGAAGGEMAGDFAGGIAEKLIRGEKLTREELIQNAFEPAPTQPGAAVNPRAVAGASAGNEGQQEIHFRASDGSMHAIPANENALAHAKVIDPGLQVVPE